MSFEIVQVVRYQCQIPFVGRPKHPNVLRHATFLLPALTGVPQYLLSQRLHLLWFFNS
jgi:hypothetical protein